MTCVNMTVAGKVLAVNWMDGSSGSSAERDGKDIGVARQEAGNGQVGKPAVTSAAWMLVAVTAALALKVIGSVVTVPTSNSNVPIGAAGTPPGN